MLFRLIGRALRALAGQSGSTDMPGSAQSGFEGFMHGHELLHWKDSDGPPIEIDGPPSKVPGHGLVGAYVFFRNDGKRRGIAAIFLDASIEVTAKQVEGALNAYLTSDFPGESHLVIEEIATGLPERGYEGGAVQPSFVTITTRSAKAGETLHGDTEVDINSLRSAIGHLFD